MTPTRTGTVHPAALARIASALLLALAACAPSARSATVYVGSWGTGPSDGRVFRHESGTSWTEVSPPSGLGSAVWDLEWMDGSLWAGVGTGGGAGFSGRVYAWDGSTWTDVSPAGGFASPVTSVTVVGGLLHATARDHGLYRRSADGTWAVLGTTVESIGQGFVSSAHEGRPMLFLGEDHFDDFWIHDPSGALACGDACPIATGALCPAGCHGGSCIYSFTEFDGGSGPSVYAGAWAGAMYRFDDATHRFVPTDVIASAHVQGLASYRGRLFVGDSAGEVWSTPDGSAAAKTLEAAFTFDSPISDMLAVPSDDVLWIGFGGVPFGFGRPDGTSMVRRFDGTSFTAMIAPGQFRQGVIAMLAVEPLPTAEIRCHAGAEQAVPCAGPATRVTLDGSATEILDPNAATATYTWTGPFLEGAVSGAVADVTFAGTGDHAVTLTVTLGSLTASCGTTVRVTDAQPPEFEAARACLWPPNHRYRCFSVDELVAGGSATALDACEGPVAVRVVAAFSSQPEDETPAGDGHTVDDLLFDDTSVCVRSERQGADAAGRSYEVVLEAVDSSGNRSTRSATLFVPHDQREATRCAGHAVGLLPRDPLPLGPDRAEGMYPVSARLPRR